MKFILENKLIELSKDCDGILSSILDKIDEKIDQYDFLNKVKIISNFAVGFRNIDTRGSKKKEILL